MCIDILKLIDDILIEKKEKKKRYVALYYHV